MSITDDHDDDIHDDFERYSSPSFFPPKSDLTTTLRSYVIQPAELIYIANSRSITLRERIVALQEELSSLKADLAETERLYGPSPIRNLPVELHRYIFELSGAFNRRDTAITVASVCFHWRNIALSCPQITRFINTELSQSIKTPQLKKPAIHVIGFDLTWEQLFLVACSELTKEVVCGAPYDEDPFLAMRAECLFQGKEYDVLALNSQYNPESMRRYLYIVRVVPSWTGKAPPPTGLPVETKRFYNEHGRHPKLVRLKVRCIVWPSHIEPEPWWVKKSVWKSTQKAKAKLALKESAPSEKNSEGAPTTESTDILPLSSTIEDQPTIDTTSGDGENKGYTPPSACTDLDPLATAITNQPTPIQDETGMKEASGSSTANTSSTAADSTVATMQSPSDKPTRTRKRKVAAPPADRSTRPKRACTMKNRV